MKVAKGEAMKTTEYRNIPELAQPAGVMHRIRRPWIGIAAVVVLFVAVWLLFL
jgi:hypothetical protein